MKFRELNAEDTEYFIRKALHSAGKYGLENIVESNYQLRKWLFEIFDNHGKI